jgi:peroxiredoxin Q/BCP
VDGFSNDRVWCNLDVCLRHDGGLITIGKEKKGESVMAAEVGQRFPSFDLKNQDGKNIRLDDFAGKWLVLYVYPKDDTPGCTHQGKSFTATKSEFDAANIAVVGLSEDGVASHKDFCNKFGFTIDLLADPEHKLLQAAGVGRSEYKGAMYWDRTTFVIDPDGVLRKVYLKVRPEGHERTLLTEIKEMQKQLQFRALQSLRARLRDANG